MIEIFGLVFAVLFVLAVVQIGRGIWMTSRMSSKVFNLVNQQLDQHLAANSKQTADSQTVECSHCGSSVDALDKCPNCGATL